MADFNRVKLGDKAKYIISSIDELDENRGYLLSFKQGKRTLMSRLYVANADIENYHVGDELELVPWTMDIIPIQKMRNGELKTYRVLQGLGWDETDAMASARRSSQNMYDTAEYVAASKQSISLCQAEEIFSNFVTKEDFLQLLEGAH